MRVNLQPGYVLHSRPYRDSSALLDVFTAEHGRISLVARGVRRRSRKGSSAALLQPFIPLLVSFSGRSDLMTLVAVESTRGMVTLPGTRLFSALYLNELLMRLLHRNDAHPRLFAAYASALQQLSQSATIDTVLRRFEFTLLNELGYSFDLGVDAASGQPVEESGWYRYDPGVGLVGIGERTDRSPGNYSGSDLLAIKGGDMEGAVRQTAKHLLREALAVHLGGAPLRSRELFHAATLNNARNRTLEQPEQ